MRYRTMPLKADRLSILGFGCMRFPTTADEKIDREKATIMLQAALDAGVNYFDTAYIYHAQESEVFLGEFLKDGRRDNVKIATKLPCWQIKDQSEFDTYLEEQLKRLQTDHIDYYLLHSLGKDSWKQMRELGVLDWLTRTQASGKIRHVGFSFHDDYSLFRSIVDAYRWDFCQIQLNYYDISYQAGLRGMRYAASQGLGIIAMEPIRGGFLADPLPSGVQAVWDKSREKHSAAERALRFLWNYPQIQIILSGMSTLEQVQQNVASAELGAADSLTTHEQNLYPQARKAFRSRSALPCTGCNYCQPCPSKVAIPYVFSLYNQGKIFDGRESTLWQYMHFCPAENRADNCTECGECLSKCPQHIDIPSELKKVAEYFSEA